MLRDDRDILIAAESPQNVPLVIYPFFFLTSHLHLFTKCTIEKWNSKWETSQEIFGLFSVKQ